MEFKDGRWLIDGELDSEDDGPEAPPMATPKKKEPEPQPKEDQDGGTDLTRPAFSGALANRRRPKKGGAAAGKVQEKRQPFNPTALTPKKPFAEDPKVDKLDDSVNVSQVDPALYKTAIDISQSEIVEEPTKAVDASELSKQAAEDLARREAEWENIFDEQRQKLTLSKDRVRRFQRELLRCRQENEQTIEAFTQLCEDLKFRGIDEVEELQGKVKALEK